jgi:hypothetical protein
VAQVLLDQVGLSLMAASSVMRQINGVWTHLLPFLPYGRVSSDGFDTVPTGFITYYYTSANCTGTAYLDASGVPVAGYLVNPQDPANGGRVATVTIGPRCKITSGPGDSGGECGYRAAKIECLN